MDSYISCPCPVIRLPLLLLNIRISRALMASYCAGRSMFVKLSSFVLFFSSVISVSAQSDNYIIHMDISVMPKVYPDHHSWYLAAVQSVLDSPSLAQATTTTGRSSSSSVSKLIYSYTHAIQGFSAHLSPSELDAIKNSPGYVSSIQDLPVKPDTTHSFQFLGLNADSGVWPDSEYGQDVIIGVIDTGVWPESQSFRDDGMTGIPSRWKGECEVGTQFNSSMCNKKLIGARYFNKGLTAKNPNTTLSMNSTRDTEGHGTHTSSTAAGNYVEDASFFGYAPGTARGMAPRARVAMYKALWAEGSYTSDIIAAVDQAILDGVDVLSLSLGLDVATLHQDPVAIATFAAVEKGIFVSTSSGNEGPFYATLHNGTPWVITVAAGSMDRRFGGVITLGDGVQVEGTSLFPGNPDLAKTPLVFMEFCNNSMALNRAGEKIIVCEDINDILSDQIDNVQIANVSGGIFITNNSDIEFYIQTQVPAIFIDSKNGEIIKDYIKKASGQPEAAMEFGKTIIGANMLAAPKVASYSSRGPSPSCPAVLKPDILAPGSQVLAAWPDQFPSTVLKGARFLYSKFNLLSGTSMSCPHVSGVAALLRAARPEWSPAAIRSAMMTTSYSTDNTNSPIADLGDTKRSANPLAMGAGHINPNKAMDPGLVYDATMEEYTDLICALNYTAKQIQTITRSASTNCSNPSLDLNYPSFIVLLDGTGHTKTREFHRTVTNVGDATSSYTASLTPMEGFKLSVEPQKLDFKEKQEKLRYKLTVEGPTETADHVVWGYLSWTDRDGKYEVKSPIVATTLPS